MDHSLTGNSSATLSDFSAHEARERLENPITQLAAHIAAATYDLLLLIGQYDQDKGWVRYGLASCAHWLQWRCGRVSAETSRRMACDAAVVKRREDEDGEPLSIGRKSRTIPPAIRRALQIRDGGCRFPGCSYSRFVDAHQILHWADGGETAMDNLVLLCRRHHRLVHEGGFGVHRGAGDGIRFSYPNGDTLPATADGRFRGNARQVLSLSDEKDLEITARTLWTEWTGEPIDYNYAQGKLAQYDMGCR